MKFNDKKKHGIIVYLLEKIRDNTPAVSKTVAEVFGVNPSTIHGYLKELISLGVIKKDKRDKYELVNKEYCYDLAKNNTGWEESKIFDKYLSGLIDNFSGNVKDIWRYAFSEMVNNVIDHSGSNELRIMICQNYLETRVKIIDDGIGIFKKIKEYFEMDSLDDAVSELFKGKLTTDKENHSGEGIFFSSRMMDDFYIVSDGKVFTHNKYGDQSIYDQASEVKNGTCVIMALSNFTNKTSKEIFDSYADAEGSFYKTKIPLKSIFEEYPVSRSQAKRICNRLEGFKEVVLDFEGVSWMGQGFAHQIFVVFANSHPEIRLTPINMNEDVTRMHYHVLNS